MFRTDHCYPPTVHAPLYPTVEDHHFEAITMPAPLPPAVEPLAPSPRHTNNPPVPARKAVYIPKGADQQGRQATGVYVRTEPQPPRRVPWLACAVGAALFLVGFCVGRMLP